MKEKKSVTEIQYRIALNEIVTVAEKAVEAFERREDGWQQQWAEVLWSLGDIQGGKGGEYMSPLYERAEVICDFLRFTGDAFYDLSEGAKHPLVEIPRNKGRKPTSRMQRRVRVEVLKLILQCIELSKNRNEPFEQAFRYCSQLLSEKKYIVTWMELHNIYINRHRYGRPEQEIVDDTIAHLDGLDEKEIKAEIAKQIFSVAQALNSKLPIF